MNLRHTLAAVALLAPLPAAAQLGVSLGFRSSNGEETVAVNSDRKGYELRAHYDGAWTPAWGWRAELAGVQMQYQRGTAGIDRTQDSENGVEAALLGRATVANGALTGLYAVAGPIGSFRVNCGRSGAFTDCDPTPAQRLGAVVGVGFTTPQSERREWVFEVRYSDPVASGAGASTLTVAFGVRGLFARQMAAPPCGP